MRDRLGTSWLALRLLQFSALLLLVLLAGSVSSNRQTDGSGVEAFTQETLRRWCQAHGGREDLQAVVVDVRFRAETPGFSEGEGAVIAPLALDLAGSQRVLEVASLPAPLRTLNVQGIHALAWEYGGRMHRPMRFAGLALVERPALAYPTLPERPTFAGMPAGLRAESLVRAAELQEHGLDKCATFPEWARTMAGEPPHTAQLARLLRATSNRPQEQVTRAEDVCAAIRVGRFTPHWAQVVVVMAARELGVPALALASASAREIYLVGTYTDQLGWILLDVEQPDKGWFTGGPPLLTRAPLLGGFPGSRHDFWMPDAAAFADTEWNRISAFSTTEWRGLLSHDHAPTDTTEARSLRLAEVCR